MRKYYRIFLSAFYESLFNYKFLIGISIFLIVCLVVFSQLWNIVSLRLEGLNLDRRALLWFIALNEWILLAIPRNYHTLESDFNSGKFALNLIRPLSQSLYYFCTALGQFCVNFLVLGIISFVFTWISVGAPPICFATWGWIILEAFFAGILGICAHMVLGICAFWTTSIDPFVWIWEKLLFALGGLLVPLAAYPMLLQKIAAYTPFPLILAGRSARIFETGCEEGLILIKILCWILGCMIVFNLLYRKALRSITMEGG